MLTHVAWLVKEKCKRHSLSVDFRSYLEGVTSLKIKSHYWLVRPLFFLLSGVYVIFENSPQGLKIRLFIILPPFSSKWYIELIEFLCCAHANIYCLCQWNFYLNSNFLNNFWNKFYGKMAVDTYVTHILNSHIICILASAQGLRF